MKKLLFLFVVVCCLSVTLPANAGETIRYVNYGGCELIVKHCTNWTGGSWVEYGLAKQGRVILEPKCEMWYNEGLHLLIFRCMEGLCGYRVAMFYADTGECVYSHKHICRNKEPYVTFEQDKEDGQYINAIMHTEGFKPYVIGTYYRKDGKTYRREKRMVMRDVPLSSPAQCTSGQCRPK